MIANNNFRKTQNCVLNY